MKAIHYASAVGSLMCAILCTRPDIYYVVGMVNRYQSKPGPKHWTVVKHSFKYSRRTRTYMLIYGDSDLIPIGYTNSDFMLNIDSKKLTFGYVFTLGGIAISWRSIKQQCIADSITEAEYVSVIEEAKELIWLNKFLLELDVVPQAQ